MLNEKEVNELKEEVDILNGLLAKCESLKEEVVLKKLIGERELLFAENDSVRRFIVSEFELNAPDDIVKWFVRTKDMVEYHEQYCRENPDKPIMMKHFNIYIEAIPGVSRISKSIRITDADGSFIRWKSVRAWEGLRKKGTSGILEVK